MKKMIWVFNILAVTFIFLSVCVGVTVAQPLPYSLSGHILDTEDEYIIGAEITLINERTNDILELVSTTNGEYQQDAYNFINHYKNDDTIRYNIIYGNISAVELRDIDISKGGTKLDIVLTKEGIPTSNSTHKSKPPRKTATHMYTDTDGDGISDNEERARGWDKLDPCIPNTDSFACKGKSTPQLTPEVFSPFVEEPTPIPTLKATPRQSLKATESPKRISGFIGLELLVVILLFLCRRNKKRRKK